MISHVIFYRDKDPNFYFCIWRPLKIDAPELTFNLNFQIILRRFEVIPKMSQIQMI